MNHEHIPFCWHLIGQESGPCVVILGGTHGDEMTGIQVVQKCLELCSLTTSPAGTYPSTDIRGELFLVFGNPEAIRLHTRSASGDRNLNRFFIDEDLNKEPRSDDPYDLIRARALAPMLARADYVFDLHGTSNDSAPFVVCGDANQKILELCRLLPIDYILTDSSHVLAKDFGLQNRGTTDAYVEAHGGVAIGYETGKEDDTARAESVLQDVVRLLQFIGTISSHATIPQFLTTSSITARDQRVFRLTRSIHAASQQFVYEPGMDRGWQMVTEGQCIGRYQDGKQEVAPSEGMLIFPKSVQKIVPGENIYYLAQEVEVPHITEG